MNKRILAGLFALAAFSSPALKAHAQAPFEGTVVWTVSIPQLDEEKHEMLINVKGEKTEMEMDLGVQGRIRFYHDAVKKKNYIVLEAQHMGMEMPEASAEAAAAAGADKIDLKATGKKATVAGHAAEEYTLTTEKGQATIWVSADFPKEIRDGFMKAMSSNNQGGKKQLEAFKQLADKGMFPVKIEVKDAGETLMAMELVKLDAKPLGDALFVPPTDIKFNPMPKGMHGQD